MTPTELVQEWFDKVWNECDVAFIDEHLAPSCEMTGLSPEPIRSPAEFRAYRAGFQAAFSDLQTRLDDVVAEGDRVAGSASVTATHKGTGKTVRFKTMFIATVKDARLVTASTNLVDYYGILVQLGAVDADALERAMA